MLTRALAVLYAVLLFNQSAFAIARECRADVTPQQHHQHQGDHSRHTPAPTQSHDAHAKCCDALSSCGQTFASESQTPTDVILATTAALVPAPRALLSMAAVAPETPPPRA